MRPLANTKTIRTKGTLFLWTILIWMVLPLSLHAHIDSTINDGVWGDPSVWSDGTVPTSSDSVVIAKANAIQIKGNFTCEHLTIQEGQGGTFNSEVTGIQITDGYKLTVNDDIVINGFNTDVISVCELLGTAELEVGGDLHLNGSSVNAKLNLKNSSVSYIGGDIILDSDGNISTSNSSKIVLNGSSAQSIDISSNTNFNDITINSSSIVSLNGDLTSTELAGDIVVQNGTFSNNGYSIADGSTFQVQTGATFLMTGTSGLPSGMTHDIQSGAILEYGGGAQIINMPNNSQNFADLRISGTGAKTLGEAVTVDGDLTISSQTLDANGNNLTVNGDWLNTGGSFTAGSASVTFSGSSQQSIQSNGSTFNNVTFNNSSHFTLNDVMTIDGSCTLENGVVTTNNDTLVLTSTTTSDLSGGGDTSFVNGYLKRYIGNNTSTYAFPVGKGTGTSSYYLAEVINNNMNNVSYIVSNYIAVSTTDDDNLSAEHTVQDTITYAGLVRSEGVWMLEPNNQPTSGSYDLKCHIDNYIQSALVDNEIGLLKRPLGSSNNGANWSAAGEINPENGDGRLVSDGYVLSKNMTSFSEFGVGGTDNASTLPIELMEFNAKMVDRNVDLHWSTATETNNDFFSIQRSSDGQNFTTIDTMQGAGNSTTVQHYSYRDGNPLKGTSYYRLKQTDFNGKFSFSDIEVINNQNSNFSINVSPNPVPKGQTIQVNLGSINNGHGNTINLNVYHAVSGQLVNHYTFTEQSAVNIPANLKNGIYVIRGNVGKETFTEKIIIQ